MKMKFLERNWKLRGKSPKCSEHKIHKKIMMKKTQNPKKMMLLILQFPKLRKIENHHTIAALGIRLELLGAIMKRHSHQQRRDVPKRKPESQ